MIVSSFLPLKHIYQNCLFNWKFNLTSRNQIGVPSIWGVNIRSLGHQKTLCSNQYSFWRKLSLNNSCYNCPPGQWGSNRYVISIFTDTLSCVPNDWQAVREWLRPFCHALQGQCTQISLIHSSMGWKKGEREPRIQRVSESLFRIQDLKYLFLLHLRKKKIIVHDHYSDALIF